MRGLRIGFIGVTLLFVVASESAAQAAATAGNPQIPMDELQILLTPLTKSELAIEAGGWIDLLRAKVKEISAAELEAKRKGEEIEITERSAAAMPKAQQQAETQAREKSGLLEQLNELRAERTALLDRVNVVLGEFEKKGGDAAEYRKYASAVSGVRLDVSDTAAALATISGWLRSPEGGLRWLKHLLLFAAIAIAFWFVSMLAGRAVTRILRRAKNVTVLMRDFAAKSVRRVLLAVGVVVGLSALEVDIAPLLALIGAAGFVLAFALQETLGSLASGVMILIYRPFDVGDTIEVAGVEGAVASLSLASVTLKTFDNKTIVIPNKSVWAAVITNATGSQERRVDMVFGIGYKDDAEKAQAILERIVRDHPKVLKRPEPLVRLHALADSSVNFICRPWAKTEDYWEVYWDIVRRVKQEFDANGITIPYPQREVYVHHVGAETQTKEV